MKLLVQGKKPGLHAEQWRIDSAMNCAEAVINGDRESSEYWAAQWRMWSAIWRFWLWGNITYRRLF